MIIDKNKLKNQLQRKNITMSSLTQHASVSSRTLARISKGENVATVVAAKIATFLDCDLRDISYTNEILETLRSEKNARLSGGLYHQTQIVLTYNSNHIEGSKLTEEQTRYIYETQTIGELPPHISVDDIVETNNHFKCVDYIIDCAEEPLNGKIILDLHRLLKQGTTYASQYGAGGYKSLPNTVGGIETTLPENIEHEMKQLVADYAAIKKVTFENIVELHYRFETIHPFQDGNGRVGRLLCFKECLRYGIVPFYIDDAFKSAYYRGLTLWKEERGYLLETCLFGQDKYKALLNYFRIKY